MRYDFFFHLDRTIPESTHLIQNKCTTRRYNIHIFTAKIDAKCNDFNILSTSITLNVFILRHSIAGRWYTLAVCRARVFSTLNSQTKHLSRDMFPTMWYVRPAKSQISLRIRAD